MELGIRARRHDVRLPRGHLSALGCITDWLRFLSAAPIVNHMVERSEQLNAVFHALAHDARLGHAAPVSPVGS